MRNARNSGRSNRRKNNNGRSKRDFSRHKQPVFDPTHLISQTKKKQPKIVAQEKYQVQNQFNDLAISDSLKKNILRKGYISPTPIQDQVIPYILKNKDVVGIANTGTGKTAAFLIPLLNKVIENKNEKVLIIAPTRELAIQVRNELKSFSDGLRMHSTICIGGSSINRQIDSLKRGQNFVIGTPGRIKDLNQRGKLRFDQFTNIVLDEVDRMLDMGFVHEIRRIIEALPRDRQSLFFSATMTPRVQGIMKGFLNDPVHISVKTKDASENVKQEIIRVKGRSKIDLLHELLNDQDFEKVLVFGRTKRGAERIKRNLNNKGLRVDAIHGNKSQGQRQRALKRFKNDQVQALVATDVVARGVDIDDISHVINYDLPESYENYIHRIGRTGRANKQGVALTFVD